MIQAAKIIGTGLATTGLIGAGVGICVTWEKISTKVYSNMKWVFNSPPKPHCFTNVPSHSCMICTLIGLRSAQAFNDMDTELVQEIALAIVTAVIFLLSNQDSVTIDNVLVWIAENSPNIPLSSAKDAMVAQFAGHYASIMSNPGVLELFHSLMSNISSANIATYSNVAITNHLNITSFIQADILYEFLSQVRLDSAIYAALLNQIQNFRR